MASDEDLAATEPATAWQKAGRDSVALPPVFVVGTEEARYDHERVLGEGGMGIVALHRDQRIGRRVAMKVLRSNLADDVSQRRFLREAQVQGQLEHPAIVPVYDLGSRQDGSIFFTMKQVRGVTLHEVVLGLRRGDPATAQKYSRRRLLGAFAQVCLAVDFAHSRGVIHRDLKPANVMLGDFGEVYVLDWGIAKLSQVDDEEPITAGTLTPVPVPETEAGAMLGTPGYMAPEQLRGDPIDPTVDVYALGAILFELLALEPLHRRARLDQLMASTLDGVDARPSARAPALDVPPELDVVCEVATAVDPKDRYGSVRELHDAVEDYLAGERDLTLRQAKAVEHANAALEAAAESTGDEGLAARRHAMRQVGKALGLDPDNHQAMTVMVKLLTEPPKQLPPEVAAAIDRGERDRFVQIARIGTVAYLAVWSFLPLILWIGVNDYRPVIVLMGGALVASATSFAFSRMKAPDPRLALVPMVASNIAFGAASGLLGPLVFVPSLVCVNTVAFAIHVARRYRPLVLALGLASFLVPLGLELVGVLSPSYAFQAGGMMILPRTLELDPVATIVVLVVAQTVVVILAAVAIGVLRNYLDRAERQTFTYAWHLREFVPDAHKRGTDPVNRGRPSIDQPRS